MHLRSRNCHTLFIAFLIAPLLGTNLAGCGKQVPGGDSAGAGGVGTSAGATSGGGTGSGSGSSGPGGTSGGSSSSSSGTSGTSGAGGAGTAGSAANRAGAVIEDTVITTKLKAALLADTTLKGASISVETRNGEVVLTGSVNSQAQREHAAQIAQALDGVKNVNNKLAMK